MNNALHCPPSISFFRGHRIIILLIATLLSLIFCIQLYLSSNARESLENNNPQQAMTKAAIGFQFENATETEITSFISSLRDIKSDIEYIEVTGLANITSQKSETTPFRLFSFFPSIDNKHVSVERGNFAPEEKDALFLTLFAASELETYGFIKDNSLLFSDSVPRDISGVVILIIPGSNEGAIVDFDSFFMLASNCDCVMVQLKEQPDQRTYQKIVNCARINLPDYTLNAPYSYSDYSLSSYYKELALYTAMIVLCVINAMSLFSFLLSKWRREFRVARIVGGRSRIVWQSVFITILIMCVVSVVPGTVLYKIWSFLMPGSGTHQSLGGVDIAIQAGIFSTSLLLSGAVYTAMFVRKTNHAMTEEPEL